MIDDVVSSLFHESAFPVVDGSVTRLDKSRPAVPDGRYQRRRRLKEAAVSN